MMTAMESAATPSADPVVVRHGAMRRLGAFIVPPAIPELARQSKVIVRTDRGLEVGTVLCPATDAVMAAIPEPANGTIERIMTAADALRAGELEALQSGPDYDLATRLFQEHRLPMQLAQVERLFGGERIVFYFLAENRVDFRELVRVMARAFQSRIELRQIGLRDEAKLIADYGDCGKPLCCNTHLIAYPPVSMRMAKIQKPGLDAAKITGRCGRLKCCLRYEQDVYEEHQAALPAVGSMIETVHGSGKVLAQELLAKQVLVALDDGRRVAVPLSEVTGIRDE
jgi:cell fate regulator YaaT (PSP1 superfamily)